MSVGRYLAAARALVLRAAFHLLYTRLGFLHETVGRTAYGAAWDGRRRHVLPARRSGTLLDIGCGEGRLLATAADDQRLALGVEPSPVMSRRAHRRGASVLRATAQAIPVREGTIQHVVATYPGPWILDRQTWEEIGRITSSGATVSILLGGDIRRGRGAGIRRLLLRATYGTQQASPDQLPLLGSELIAGAYTPFTDQWGTAIVWTGTRRTNGDQRSNRRMRGQAGETTK